MHRFVDLGDNGDPRYLLEEDRHTRYRQVLWGDYLTIEGEEPDGFFRVRWAPSSPDARTLFIPKSHTVETRPLEIIFVDVGQGDGAVLITAFRTETGSAKKRWFYYEYALTDAGELRLVN